VATLKVTSFAIRNSVLYTLTSDGIVTREPLSAAGIPASSATITSRDTTTETVTRMAADVDNGVAKSAKSVSSFNLTELVYRADCRSDCGNKTTVKNMGVLSMLTVDSQGTAYVRDTAGFPGVTGGTVYVFSSMEAITMSFATPLMTSHNTEGTAYVFSGVSGPNQRTSSVPGGESTGRNVLYVVNASDAVVGNIHSLGSDPVGAISQTGFYGWVASFC
jgi:hypothetical protein